MKQQAINRKQLGQSLIEVLVVLVVAVMMILALITVILSSLKNAQFAQNQTKATKLAQDAIDKIRILRDGNKNLTLTDGTSNVCFDQLWNRNTGNFVCGTTCYYKFTSSTGASLLKVILSNAKENIGDGFSRQILVSQTSDYEVRLVVQVSWTDSSGEHNSNIETVLIKPDYDCAD